MASAPTSSDDWLPAETLEFPDGFIWGTSCAAHQVEGGNVNNDWWAWEQNPASGCVEPSGDATDYWNRYTEDLDLCARSGGQNAHRFSIEWSRVEPAEGSFSEVALDHYKRLADSCIERGLTPIITLHHFTTPLWATKQGTWADDAIVDRFARFAQKTARALGPDRLEYVCTINEPQIVATLGYFLGMFPPGLTDADAQARATANMIRAHAAAVEAVKGVAPAARVGVSLAMADLEPFDPEDAAAGEFTEFVRHRMQTVYIEALRTGEVTGLAPAVDDFVVDGIDTSSDFVGCQYYTRWRMNPSRPDFRDPEPEGSEMTMMDYASYPPGLRKVLSELAATHYSIIITENGMCTPDDARRCAWIAAHLRCAHDAMTEDGVDLRGYTYWSTTDNFEWALGYRPTFGLIGIDRDAGLARVPRPSLDLFGEIAAADKLDPAVVSSYVSA